MESNINSFFLPLRLHICFLFSVVSLGNGDEISFTGDGFLVLSMSEQDGEFEVSSQENNIVNSEELSSHEFLIRFNISSNR